MRWKMMSSSSLQATSWMRDRRKSLVSMIIQNDREDEGGNKGDEGNPNDRTREREGGRTVGLVDPGEGGTVKGAVELNPSVDL